MTMVREDFHGHLAAAAECHVCWSATALCYLRDVGVFVCADPDECAENLNRHRSRR